MEISADRVSFLIVAAVFAGGALGSGLVYQQMDQEIDRINDEIAEQSSTQIKYINGSEAGLSALYQKVDPSVVIVNARGNEASQGSGFIYSKNGYIITNEHVIDNANNIQIRFSDETTRQAEIIGEDPYTDLAVLKVDKSGLKPLQLANSTEVKPGQKAIAMGGPFGLGNSLTAGYISQVGRSLPVQEIGLEGFRIRDVIQTDAAINPGNSGGPLLNREGEVIGVNTAIETNTGTFSGIGFAVPSNTVKRVAPQIIEQGEAGHPWIGVRGTNVNQEIADAMNLNSTQGFLVMNTSENGPAEEAGIRPGNRTIETERGIYTVGGDVIIGINGQEMNNLEDVLQYLAREAEVGEEITITVLRNGEEVEVPLTLADRPEEN